MGSSVLGIIVFVFAIVFNLTSLIRGERPWKPKPPQQQDILLQPLLQDSVYVPPHENDTSTQ